VFMALIVLISCNNGNLNIIKKKDLKAIELKDEFFTPQEGLALTEARKLIIEELKDNGVKGDVEKVAITEEITIQEIWENIGTQLYKVNVDYAWIYGVAIIKDNRVLQILNGMPTEGIFIADIDKDSYYEVYTNIAMGSGIISNEILGFNIVSQEKYHLAMRGKQDFSLFVEDNILMANISTYPNINKIERTGKVLLKTKANNRELYIE
jgi:hypothetical protein